MTSGNTSRSSSLPVFVEAYPKLLSDDLCDRLVARFEADKDRYPSRTAAGPSANRSGEMASLRGAHWQDLAGEVDQVLRQALAAYAGKYQSMQRMVQAPNFTISTPVIERIRPGQGFGWHIDAGPRDTHDRFVSALCYLATVDEGGLTEFPYQGVAVKPTKGLMVLFPPFWTHLHRGAPPVSGTKYNLTSFFLRTAEWQAA